MTNDRHRFPAVLAAAALIAAGCGADGGAGTGGDPQTWPSEDMTLYVPYAPGGPTDNAARATGERLGRELGVNVVVENRPGGSGSIGMQAMINEGNDGHALSFIAVPATATNPLQMDVGYDNDDYTPVAAVIEIPSLLAVPTSSPHTDAGAFFDAARQSPGSLTIGVPGSTTSQAMEITRLADLHDVALTPIPFDGNAEMTTALLGANVDAVLINASQDVIENVEAGQFVPLAQSGPERVDYLADVPTLAESGFPELTASVSLFGLAVPAGVDDAIVARLEEVVREALEDPEFVQRVDERYVPQQFVGRADFEQRIAEIVQTYGPILQG